MFWANAPCLTKWNSFCDVAGWALAVSSLHASRTFASLGRTWSWRHLIPGPELFYCWTGCAAVLSLGHFKVDSFPSSRITDTGWWDWGRCCWWPGWGSLIFHVHPLASATSRNNLCPSYILMEGYYLVKPQSWSVTGVILCLWTVHGIK